MPGSCDERATVDGDDDPMGRWQRSKGTSKQANEHVLWFGLGVSLDFVATEDFSCQASQRAFSRACPVLSRPDQSRPDAGNLGGMACPYPARSEHTRRGRVVFVSR